MAMWEDLYNISASQTNRTIMVATSSDDGETWSYPTQISDNLPSYGPAAAGDGDGTWVAIYCERRSGAGYLKYAISKDHASTWSAPLTIPKSYNSTTWPILNGADLADVIYGKGMFVVGWTGAVNQAQEVFLVSTSDGGTTWTPPLRLGSEIPLGQYMNIFGCIHYNGSHFGVSFASNYRFGVLPASAAHNQAATFSTDLINWSPASILNPRAMTSPTTDWDATIGYADGEWFSFFYRRERDMPVYTKSSNMVNWTNPVNLITLRSTAGSLDMPNHSPKWAFDGATFARTLTRN